VDTLKINVYRAGRMLALLSLAGALSAEDLERELLVLTSTNAATNEVVVFRLNTSGQPSLPLAYTVPTGGKGGAGGNAGAVQFDGHYGAVVNYGSNTVTQLARTNDVIRVARTIPLAKGCTSPVSVALAAHSLFVAGANCAESLAWPSGGGNGNVAPLPDNSAAQIVVGQSWAGVTLKSGSVIQLSLNNDGALTGAPKSIALPPMANDTPLGAAFWGDVMGLNPAHSPASFALVNKSGTVFPVTGPQPPFPVNAPCWLAKGPGSIWYSGNSPANAISIFFSDGQGGSFYKSVPLPGSPTDITVSPDRKWLAVIYAAADGGHVAVFSIDAYGDLSLVATSNAIGVARFNGVAFSQ
jgi:hypothetical protein